MVRSSSPVERISPNDATTLVTDRGAVPMNIGAVLVVEDGAALDFDEVRATFAARLPRVRRLRQRIQRTPLGCGRPVWVDASEFDLSQHLHQTALGPRGSAGTPVDVLDEAAAMVCTRLPQDRPLWASRWVTGLPDGAAALLLVMHHCLADGLGGLAVLAALADGGTDPAVDDFPREPPSSRDLFADALHQRGEGIAASGRQLKRAAAGLRELLGGHRRVGLVARTSLNRPTGPTRRLTTVTAPLSTVVAAAHAHGGTVNDVILTAVAGALGVALRGRGESVSEIVASVPISSRRTTTVERLGNETGVLPLALPLVIDPTERLRRIVLTTKARRASTRGASAAPLGVAFRSLAAVGAFRAMVDHQRLVHTFITNVRGPAVPLHLAGHRITTVVPIATTPGNIGVSFGILSYAGELVVTVVADPSIVPEQDDLTAALDRELRSLLH